MELKPNFEFEKFHIGVEEIKAETELLIKQGNEAKASKGMFTVMEANVWMAQAKTRPIPKMLLGEFWFEGELCIL
ncbi:MAG: LuxR family transcriptional regulator, partial [Cyclobacteriaceae bacterium]|nr:LuxR family transcriptional regulator [Cyclobacteriaceae bacterium]